MRPKYITWHWGIYLQYEETKKGTNPGASSQEPKVIIWREKKGDVTRSVNDVPTICGVQLPQFCFIAIIAALGLGMYNIRALLLKEFVLKLKDDLLNQGDGRG
ncbi:hypothetical protein SAMN05660706_104125 [Desulfoscipio geothermicus DSM 3669]|uniref:Uncharacterized protein n=1 Tax=Desulfoscipio geothermicus DSM 3669 TaxID=1121426 RepID=A0A1I6D2N7_9FIRM|nr:hypothetical protein SAMN05660706_104125 [Desulfoscipio geothermicus DSM 3669]